MTPRGVRACERRAPTRRAVGVAHRAACRACTGVRPGAGRGPRPGTLVGTVALADPVILSPENRSADSGPDLRDCDDRRLVLVVSRLKPIPAARNFKNSDIKIS